jgi:transcriptional regulator with XRE-family HTH domain
LSHVGRMFERLLEAYRREDGRRWSGIELERATGGVVTRSYVTNLRKGRIENPGMDKLWALASRRWAFPPRSGSRRD